MRRIPTTAYDRRIEIWRYVMGSANAFNEAELTPQKVCDAWASVSNKAALERLGVAKTEAMTTEVFTVRYCAAHAAVAADSYFIRFNGRDYNVRPPVEVGYREALDILAEARADDAAV